MNYLDSLVNTENPNYQPWADEIIPKVRLVLNDYSRDYLEQYNEKEIQWIYDQIVKRVDLLRSQSNDIIAKRVDKAEYDTIMDKFKKSITDANSLLEDSTTSNPTEESEGKIYIKTSEAREKLNRLLEDAKFAKDAGLGIDELKKYMKNFELKLDEICQEEKENNNKTSENETDTKEQSGEDKQSEAKEETVSPSDTKENENSADTSSSKDSENNKEDNSEENKENKDNEENRENKDKKDNEEHKENEENKENKENNDNKDNKDNKDDEDHKENKDHKDNEDDEDSGVCLIPEESAHNKAIKAAIDRISKLENLEKNELDEFINELMNSHAGCDLNEIIIRAERKDEENLNKKIEKEALENVTSSDSLGSRVTNISSFKDSDRQNKKYRSERISGNDRVETSIKLAKKLYPNGAKTIFIVNKDKFADALASTALAKEMKAPILYTDKDSTPEQIISAIKDLAGEKIVFIGGEGSISVNQLKELKKKGYNVDRIGGSNRYETASILAEQLLKIKNNKAKEVILASAKNYADALVVSAYSAKNAIPILLVDKDHISKENEKFIEMLGNPKIHIIGGEESISKKLENYLEKTTKSPINRLAGKDRYETANIISEKFAPNAKTAVVASGERFEDALLSGGLAANEDATLLLCKKEGFTKTTDQYISSSKIENMTIVGGYETLNKLEVE